MSKSLLTRIPVPVRLGVPLAAGLMVAACSSGGGSSASGSPTSGSSPAGSPAGASTTSTVITAHPGSAGAFLTDGSGRTVYLWTKDTMDKSAANGAVLGAWPPVLAKGTVTASGGAKASDLTTITGFGGIKQVAYDGHPLYYFVGDTGPGQTSGQGSDNFGAKWWVVAPSGTQITGTETASTANAPAGNAPASPAPAPSGGNAGGGWS